MTSQSHVFTVVSRDQVENLMVVLDGLEGFFNKDPKATNAYEMFRAYWQTILDVAPTFDSDTAVKLFALLERLAEEGK